MQQRILVTGGAGFIGSNFVHYLVDHTDAPDHRPRQADLRREQGRPSRACPTTRFRLVVGDVADADGRRPARRRSRRGRALRRGVAQRQRRCADPSPFITTNLIGTFTILEAVRKADIRLHHVSTDEVYGDLELDDPNEVHRGHALPAEQSLLRLQGRLRPPGAGLGPQLRRAGDDLQLLQQLRPVAARREVHPPPDHQRPRRHPPASSTAAARTSATGSTPTTTARRCSTILEQRPDRRDLPGRRRGREERTSRWSG